MSLVVVGLLGVAVFAGVLAWVRRRGSATVVVEPVGGVEGPHSFECERCGFREGGLVHPPGALPGPFECPGCGGLNWGGE